MYRTLQTNEKCKYNEPTKTVLGSCCTKKTVMCKSPNSGLVVKVQDNILEANMLFRWTDTAVIGHIHMT